MKKFNQESFDKDHAEPRDYGEGDYYIVADTLSDEEAAKLIGHWESDLTGEECKYKADDIVAMKMFVSNKNDDGVDNWCVNNFSDEEPTAWGKGISL